MIIIHAIDSIQAFNIRFSYYHFVFIFLLVQWGIDMSFYWPIWKVTSVEVKMPISVIVL